MRENEKKYCVAYARIPAKAVIGSKTATSPLHLAAGAKGWPCVVITKSLLLGGSQRRIKTSIISSASTLHTSSRYRAAASSIPIHLVLSAFDNKLMGERNVMLNRLTNAYMSISSVLWGWAEVGNAFIINIWCIIHWKARACLLYCGNSLCVCSTLAMTISSVLLLSVAKAPAYNRIRFSEI